MAKVNRSNYIITTDSKIMDALGLSHFTFETLAQWVTYNKGHNLNYLKITDVELLSTQAIMEKILYSAPANPLYEYMSIRVSTRGGSVQTVKEIANLTNSEWTHSEWQNGVNVTKWKPSDLGFADPDLEVPNSMGYIDYDAYRLVRMNDLLLSKSSDPTMDKYKARKELIKDIKAQPTRYGILKPGVKWTSEITFIVEEGEECLEEVVFELKLYDSQRKEAEVVLQTNKFIVPNLDVTRRPILVKDEDGRLEFDQDKMNQRIGVELDMWFNPYTGKAESGTAQIMAVMETDLPAATAPVAGLTSTPSEFLKTNGDGFKPSYGRARPLMMNGNDWKQWSTEYEYPTGSDDDNEKAKLLSEPVQNKFTDTAFSDGQVVMLNKIGGVWQPVSPIGGKVTSSLVATSVDKWSFDYLMTNAEFFFRKEGGIVEFGDYEEAFYEIYYGGATELAKYGDKLPTMKNSHIQLTSFDFMGNSIGGNRTSHGLGNTQIGFRNYAGVQDNALTMPIVTSPFFGCVFPDGYDETKYDTAITEAIIATDTDYVKNIAMGTKIFDPSDGENYEGQIFSEGLTQLPADIALHCPPGNENGSPINKVVDLSESFLPTNTGIVDAFLSDEDTRYAWLYYDSADPINSNDNVVFDITPLNNKKIQFRPMKMELYASMEISAYSAVPEATRGYYGRKMWDRTNQKAPFNQAEIVSRTDSLVAGTPLGIIGADGLEYNSDIHDELAGESSLFAYNRFRNSTYPWMSSGPRPAGAFGIIGASCTLSANTSITFNTSYLWGMSEEFGGFNQITGSLWYQTFGGSNTYRSHNNTGLFVRVYTNWPTELTVYDSRYFAVFHFNYGVGSTKDQDITVKYYNDVDEISVGDWGDADSADKEYPEGIYAVEQIDFEQADFREPSYAVADNNNPSILADLNVEVYSDRSNDVDSGWREYDHWNINILSRGKLLPIPNNDTYARRTIGIDTIIIEDGGTNYQNGDTFTTSGGNGTGVVITVVGLPNTGGPITVNNLQVDNQGYDFIPDNFFTYEDVDTSVTTFQGATVTLVGVDGSYTGTGLKAYVTNGYTVLRRLINDVVGPELANPQQNGTRIIENAPVEDKNGKNDGPAIGSMETTITITNTSSDNKYNCFFFYYNDASHCFDSDHGDQTPKPYEQYVELEITSE